MLSLLPEDRADGMNQDQMDVFNLLHAVVRNDDHDVHQVLQLAPIESRESNSGSTYLAAKLHRFQHVRGIAAPADADHNVTGVCQIL